MKAIIRKQIEMALAGDSVAAKVVFDYSGVKPREEISVEVDQTIIDVNSSGPH